MIGPLACVGTVAPSPEYTWSQEALDWIGIDPVASGRCTERGEGGFEIDFGRGLEIDAPHGLRFAWCIDPNRVPIPDVDKTSVVALDFKAADCGATVLTLTHSLFERFGKDGQAYRDVMASDDGWPCILARYARSFEA